MSYNFKPPGRPKKTYWDRCLEVSHYVDRAKANVEGTHDFKMNKDKAVNAIKLAVKARSVRKANYKVIGDIMELRSKINELIKRLQ